MAKNTSLVNLIIHIFPLFILLGDLKISTFVPSQDGLLEPLVRPGQSSSTLFASESREDSIPDAFEVHSEYQDSSPEVSSPRFDYVPQSFKQASKTAKGWMTSKITNTPSENDYPIYHQLAKFVAQSTSNKNIKHLKDMLELWKPRIFIDDAKVITNVDIEYDTGISIAAMKEALVALEDEALEVQERCWTLGLYACLRNKLQSMDCDSRIAAQLSKTKEGLSRGELELRLLGGTFPIEVVKIHWGGQHVKNPDMERVKEVLERVSLLRVVSKSVEDHPGEIPPQELIHLSDYMSTATLPAKYEDALAMRGELESLWRDKQSQLWQRLCMCRLWGHLNKYDSSFQMPFH